MVRRLRTLASGIAVLLSMANCSAEHGQRPATEAERVGRGAPGQRDPAASGSGAGTGLAGPSALVAPTVDRTFRLTARLGGAPTTSKAPPGTMLAHSQLTQQAPVLIQEALFARAAALPDIHVAPSGISVPGARAFVLAPEAALGPAEAFQVGTEFAHIHPQTDGSLHMTLPRALAAVAFARGWGEPHPRSGTPLIYGPRDENELEVVWQLLLRSYLWAREGRTLAFGDS